MRHLRYLAGCAAAAAVLLASGCGSITGAGPSPSPSVTPSAISSGMTSAFQQATSVRMSGKVTQAGQTYQVDLMLTRSGDVQGSFVQGSSNIQLMSAGGKTYVRVNKDFLKLSQLPATACTRYCGKYVRVPAAAGKGLTSQMNWSALMGPITAGFRPLGTALKGNVPPSLFKAATVGGQPAWAIAATGHGRIYVAAHGTPYLLRVTGPGVDVTFSEWNAVTITPPPPSQRVTPQQLASA